MYDYVKQKLVKNRTSVHIDSNEYMSRYSIKSYSTFVAHRKELVESKIIAPSSSHFQGWYWVNPAFVYYGTRMIAFKDKSVVKVVVNSKKK